MTFKAHDHLASARFCSVFVYLWRSRSRSTWAPKSLTSSLDPRSSRCSVPVSCNKAHEHVPLAPLTSPMGTQYHLVTTPMLGDILGSGTRPLGPQVRGLNTLPHPSVQTWKSTCTQLASLVGVTTTVHASPLSNPKTRDQGQALTYLIWAFL